MLEMLNKESKAKVSLNRVKLLRVSRELLTHLFSLDGRNLVRIEGMPEDAKIVGISCDAGFKYDEVWFQVTSEEFPELKTGNSFPELRLNVTMSTVDGSLHCHHCGLTYLGHSFAGLGCPRCGGVNGDPEKKQVVAKKIADPFYTCHTL